MLNLYSLYSKYFEHSFSQTKFPNSYNEIYPDSIKDGWLTTGPQVSQFENELKSYLNFCL